MDVHTPEKRSFNMSRIRDRNTKPEIKLRKILWNRGYRYRVHYKRLPGKPDIVFPGRKKVIFVHGCFWHRHSCKDFKWPSTNKEFWRKKITDNVSRDSRNSEALLKKGWQYLVVWECEINNKNYDRLLAKIIAFLDGSESKISESEPINEKDLQ